MLKCPYLLDKCPIIGVTTIKSLNFSDAKNTRKFDAFFSKQTLSEKSELDVNEQSENRLSSSDTVIDYVEQSESRPSASISQAKSQSTHVALSELCLKIKSRLAKYLTKNCPLY